jgi:hypothetical protein
MPYVDRPLPEALELPRLRAPRPRDKRLDNLRPGHGRIRGTQNKICRDLKEGLLEGAILHGYDGAGQGGLIGYCLHLAERHPKAYCGLLGRLLPYNLNANVASAMINEVKIISVPSGGRLSPEQMARAQAGEPFVIDQSPPEQLDAPIETVQGIEPRSAEEARWLAKLNALSDEELARRVENLVAD